ncbi:hypothetical protein [Actinomadura rupiterrae]|uniref:hypothetical protein n=1 Tax=Actinomadura rupiterrae TaxID=559627 RepID=UPI0020A34A11|nr:hypothetical protein [Actinomadura rupiterrae]MCP2341583.1 hypothetical protein [Actinomadura rupiterrae]
MLSGLTAVLLASCFAAPAAARPELEPAARTAPLGQPKPPKTVQMPTQQEMALWLSPRGGPLLDEQGKILREWAVNEAGNPYIRTVAVDWQVHDLDPDQVARFIEIFKAGSRTPSTGPDAWGLWETQDESREAMPLAEFKKRRPELYQALVAKGVIKAGQTRGVIAQESGANASAGGLSNADRAALRQSLAPGEPANKLTLHAERVLQRETSAGWFIAERLRKNAPASEITARLRAWNAHIRQFPTDKGTLNALSNDDFLNPQTLPQPKTSQGLASSKSGCTGPNGCATFTEGAEALVDFDTSLDNVMHARLALGSLQAFLTRARQFAEAGDQARVDQDLESLKLTARSIYVRAQVESGAKAAQWATARKLAGAYLEDEEVKAYAAGKDDIGERIHSALLKVDSHAPNKQKQKDKAKAVDDAKAEVCDTGKGSPVHASGTIDGRRVVNAALLTAANPCGKDTSSGIAKALTEPGYGGVDFSTLELHHVADGAGTGLQFTFSGRPAGPGVQQDVGSAAAAVAHSTADLRTWLALKPDTFWVNLNPTEPDRIIDPSMGQTNAGKAMLEADFLLKKTSGTLLNPATPLGSRYWSAVAALGLKCATSRLWIVPGDVRVREDGDSLYVLKAGLAVQVRAENAGGRSCFPDQSVQERYQRIEQSMVLPEVTRTVNTAPEYAPLRRAFLSRVIAQWMRERHAKGAHTAFDKLIDSGDVASVRLTDGWQPRQVLDAYVKAFNSGDFTYKRTTAQGNTTLTETFTVGGVDFSQLHPARSGADAMNRQIPHLPDTVKASRKAPSTASDGTIWLGETAKAPAGAWSRTTDSVRSFFSGRLGLFALIVVGLAVVGVGLRPRRRKSSG